MIVKKILEKIGLIFFFVWPIIFWGFIFRMLSLYNIIRIRILWAVISLVIIEVIWLELWACSKIAGETDEKLEKSRKH